MQFRNSCLHVSIAIQQFLQWSSLCQTHLLFQISKAALNTTILQGLTCRNLFSISYQHRGETNHLVLYATQWRIFAWTHKCHWHSARNSRARYVSQHEGLCHFPTWPAFCEHNVKGHHSPPALEAQACTESLSPPGLDTNAGTQSIYWLFSTCSVAFLSLIAIKTSSLSSYKNLLFQC